MRRILWFRRDLRVEDNPLLALGGEVLPIFIFDTHLLSPLPSDDRRVSFIFSRVLRLKAELREKGLDLKLFYGKPLDIFASLLGHGFDEVAAGGDYDSYARERDTRVSLIIDFNYLHDTYIFRPDELLKADSTPYLVFTPFYKRALSLITRAHMKYHPFARQQLFQTSYEGITQVQSKMHTQLPAEIASIGFSENTPEVTEPGEKLRHLAARLNRYADERDYPALESTSELSVDLRFGTLSVRALLRFLSERKKEGDDTGPFFRQLVFREFYACLLYHYPRLQRENFKYRFQGVEDYQRYETFCRAETGVPIVDAGIRELLSTGRMHNRLRMVCASFFTKDLLLPWQWGEAFFARHLLDYDAASNILSWQWSAGTGVDPQPYFRIFNPYLQSRKFDREARYIKKWLPELSLVPPKLLYDETYLLSHRLGDYPQPMVHHKEAARTALAHFRREVDE